MHTLTIYTPSRIEPGTDSKCFRRVSYYCYFHHMKKGIQQTLNCSEKHYKGILVCMGTSLLSPKPHRRAGSGSGTCLCLYKAHSLGASGATAQVSHPLLPQEVPDAQGWGRSDAGDLQGPPPLPREALILVNMPRESVGARTSAGSSALTQCVACRGPTHSGPPGPWV